MIVRKLEIQDFHNGFLETLENLSPIGEPRPTFMQFQQLFMELSILQYRDGCKLYNDFVAQIGDREIVGAGRLFTEQKYTHRLCRVGHVEEIATRKGYEGRGYASAVLEAIEAEAKKLGCSDIRRLRKSILSCSDENLAFYEKRGYRRVENAMRKDL